MTDAPRVAGPDPAVQGVGTDVGFLCVLGPRAPDRPAGRSVWVRAGCGVLTEGVSGKERCGVGSGTVPPSPGSFSGGPGWQGGV